VRKTGDEVGGTGRNALLSKRLGHSGNALERQTNVDKSGAPAGLVNQRGNVLPGQVYETLKSPFAVLASDPLISRTREVVHLDLPPRRDQVVRIPTVRGCFAP
jgi:hypothetical protein